MSRLDVVILAAGEGKRMKSRLPKVLHRIAGRTLLERVVDAAHALSPEQIHVVIGYGGASVCNTLPELDVSWVTQLERLGTGHAVLQALPDIPDHSTVLVLYGDVPLIGADTLRATIGTVNAQSAGLLTVELEDPAGYGRIVRMPDGSVAGIVEDRDATTEQRGIREINTGIMAANAYQLKDWLGRIDNGNSQGEYYLTDIVALAVADGLNVRAVHPSCAEEVLGVNDRIQLANLERHHQHQLATHLMAEGVTLSDPSRIDIRGNVAVGEDVSIDVNVVFEGQVSLDSGVTIGPNCVIKNSSIGANSEILAHCVIEDASIGASCRIGPYSRMRPDTQLGSNVQIGNFVEIKKSRVATGTKVNHLSYVGDTELGARVNVGAGTITCNYDGANKHKTVVEDDAFIGSGTQLVAPVVIGNGSTIGAGSTITRDTQPDSLTIARVGQTTVKGWVKPTKKK